MIAPSPVPWSPRNQIPHPATRADMDTVREAFVNATLFAAQAGFDMVELHARARLSALVLHIAADQSAE